MRIGSLCSGYGGLELGVTSVLGGDVAWHSEYEPPTSKNPRPSQAAAQLLAHRFPDVPNLGDMTAVDWSSVEPVEVLCGGTPCQDVSHAGKRAGMRAGTRSGLWATMVDAVDVLRPKLVVWENVRGVLSAEADSDLEHCPVCVGDGSGDALRALGRVLGDLADSGYDARWIGLRASDVGAPHERFRVFVVAYPRSETQLIRAGLRESEQAEERRRRLDNYTAQAFSDADVSGLEGHGRLHTTTRESEAGAHGRGAWGPYEPAIRRWEHVTRAAPGPREPGRTGERLSPRFVEWMMGLPAGWVTDVPGISRNDQLKMLGNGVVPQQAAAAIRHLLDF